VAQIFPPVPWSLGPKGLIIDKNSLEKKEKGPINILKCLFDIGMERLERRNLYDITD
jgi:hypothetical protein